MAKKQEVIVGLDIGTTKIAVVVAEQRSGGQIDIIGIGTHPSKGLRKGVVINIDATVSSIHHAIQEAELMAGCEIDTVYAGIAGSHIKGFNSHGIVAVKNKEVSPSDIERVLDAARAVALPPDREILHIIPQEFIIDDQDGIKEPIGMSGVRLEAKVHIVTGAITSAENIVKSANRCGLNVADIVLEPVASAEAVLSAEEKELGVGLIDIGGGTTDITIFHAGSIKHTAVIPVGGNHITNDVASGIRSPLATAEEVKRKYGAALTKIIHPEDTFEVVSTGGRDPRVISRLDLVEIIEPRVEEILNLALEEIQKSGFDQYLISGLVLTGGSSLLEGMIDIAEDIFKVPVRIGYPTGVSGLIDVVNSPSYATAVGLILYGAKDGEYRHQKAPSQSKINLSSIKSVKNRVFDWITNNF